MPVGSKTPVSGRRRLYLTPGGRSIAINSKTPLSGQPRLCQVPSGRPIAVGSKTPLSSRRKFGMSPPSVFLTIALC